MRILSEYKNNTNNNKIKQFDNYIDELMLDLKKAQELYMKNPDLFPVEPLILLDIVKEYNRVTVALKKGAENENIK